jgi:hypothetical protein
VLQELAMASSVLENSVISRRPTPSLTPDGECTGAALIRPWILPPLDEGLEIDDPSIADRPEDGEFVRKHRAAVWILEVEGAMWVTVGLRGKGNTLAVTNRRIPPPVCYWSASIVTPILPLRTPGARVSGIHITDIQCAYPPDGASRSGP